MKITQAWVDKHHPCVEAVEWWDKEPDLFKILKKLIAEKRLDWANWFVVRLMNHKQRIRYAIYAAEQVLSNFEKKYPDDKRPRGAIEAAKRYLKNPTEKNKKAAYSAANSAYSAADSAASAYSAADSAADSAMYLKIINYGIKLLKGGTK